MSNLNRKAQIIKILAEQHMVELNYLLDFDDFLNNNKAYLKEYKAIKLNKANLLEEVNTLITILKLEFNNNEVSNFINKYKSLKTFDRDLLLFLIEKYEFPF